MFSEIEEDRIISPRTGWTRKHWLKIGSTLLKGYLCTVEESTGMPHIGNRLPENPYIQDSQLYGPREFFERTLILAAAWLKGTGVTKKPDWPLDLAESFRRAILVGTNESHPGYWGAHPPMSAFGNGIATAILVAPDYFWEPLTRGEKEQIGRFLHSLALNESWDNNHWYFHMTGLPVLDELGIDYDQTYFDEKWDRIKAWYVGDGWYLDGNNRAYDYYNHWGFHYYNCFYYALYPKWKEKYGNHIKKATKAFLTSYPYYFGDDGASVPWGRSLLYRYGLLAPLGWAELAGINPLSPGLSRRIASGNLKYFFDNPRHGQLDGVVTKDNLLEPGYLGANPNLWETYTDSGSAYWSSVGLIPLAFPENHPFWTAREEDMPADKKEKELIKIDGPSQLVRQSQGRASLFSFEQPRKNELWQLSIKYSQNGYDSSLGFAVVGEKGEDPGFNRVGVSKDGREWHYRQSFQCLELEKSFGKSRCAIDWEGQDRPIEIIQKIIPREDGEKYLIYHNHLEPVFLSFGGWSLGGEDWDMSESDDTLVVRTKDQFSLLRREGDSEGHFLCRTVAGEFSGAPTHIHGGKGVFPQWISDHPISPGERMGFFTSAGQYKKGDDPGSK